MDALPIHSTSQSQSHSGGCWQSGVHLVDGLLEPGLDNVALDLERRSEHPVLHRKEVGSQ